MSLFSNSKSRERFGVIIDVGSGSVLTAIIASKKEAIQPTIVWSRREHAPLRNIDSIEQSAKAVMTALMNSLLMLDGEGRTALTTYKKGAKITEVQTCISAPWSYTVTKTINYTQDEPFEITENLVDELVRTATQKTTAELSENNSIDHLGLTVITRITMDLLANGYHVDNDITGVAQELSLTHASVVTQQYLVDMIDDLKDKLFPTAYSYKLSYILALYCVAQELFPKTHDVCLIDITYEASEIGIVREGSLRYSTHSPFGAFSLAREIATITSVPLYEAFQYLHTEKPYSFMETLPKNQLAEVEKVFEAYINKMADLFKETGDDLSIPKKIFLHADLNSELLFMDLIEKAAKRSTKSNPIIKVITPEIFKKLQLSVDLNGNFKPSTDTAMLVSAMFFHKQNHCRSFEYL